MNIDRRLEQLEDNISELDKIRKTWTIEDLKEEKHSEWSLRYGLLESIQIVIDIACHWVVHRDLGNAETYGRCFERLRENDYIDKELEDKLKGMAGLRNILVYEYVAVDLSQLFEMLEHLNDFRRFAEVVHDNYK